MTKNYSLSGSETNTFQGLLKASALLCTALFMLLSGANVQAQAVNRPFNTNTIYRLVLGATDPSGNSDTSKVIFITSAGIKRGYDGTDADHLGGPGMNIATVDSGPGSGYYLAINFMPLPRLRPDSLPVYVYSGSLGVCSLGVLGGGTFPSDTVKLFLKDNFLGTLTPLTANLNITYTTSATAGSQGNRFAILFNPVAPGCAASVPVVTASGPLSFCSDTSVVLTSNVLHGNRWSNGDTTQSIRVLSSGSYSAVHVAGGCSSAASNAVAVTVYPQPFPPLLHQDRDTLRGDGGPGKYLWYLNGVLLPNDTISYIHVSGNGAYTLKLVSGPCTSAASLPLVVTGLTPVTIHGPELKIVPNPVTAGTFRIIGAVPGIMVTLYNAFGQDITSQITIENGLYSVGTLPAGVYFVRIGSLSLTMIITR